MSLHELEIFKLKDEIKDLNKKLNSRYKDYEEMIHYLTGEVDVSREEIKDLLLSGSNLHAAANDIYQYPMSGGFRLTLKEAMNKWKKVEERSCDLAK